MGITIIDEEKGWKYKIRPEMIHTGHFVSYAFNTKEASMSARWIVDFCKKKGGWIPFTRAEISEYGHRLFKLRGLDKNGNEPFVVLGKDDKYRVTAEFIEACFVCPS